MERLTDEQRARAGDPENIAFALAIAERFARRWPGERDEIEIAALEGLVAAARLFDPARGVEFRTHARYRIAGEILDALRRLGGRCGSRRRCAPPISLSTVLAINELGNPFTVGDAVVVDDDPVGWEMESHDTVTVLSTRLPPKYGRALLAYYTRAGATMRAIAGEIGTTESRVSQMLARAVSHYLRESVGARSAREAAR